MKKSIYTVFMALIVLVGSMFPATSIAQTKSRPAPKATQNAPDPLMSLPESNGVVSIDVQRLLNEFLPSVLSSDQPRLAEVNAHLDQIKTRTGIDVRAFDRVAVGIKFINPTPDTIKVESVALARGRFNAPAMLASSLVLAKDKYKYQEQKHGGKTIYVFNGEELFPRELPQTIISEQTKKSGGKIAKIIDDLFQKMLNFRSGQVAVAALDANTLAIGQPQHVRAAIDAGRTLARRNVALTQMATRNPKAIIGFGADVPSNVSRYIAFDNDEIAKSLNSIRQVYGSVAGTAGGFELQTSARTEDAAQAQNVHNVLVGFRDLGGFFVGNLSGEKGKLAKTALDNLKITKDANEVLIRLEMAQSDVAMLMRVF